MGRGKDDIRNDVQRNSLHPGIIPGIQSILCSNLSLYGSNINKGRRGDNITGGIDAGVSGLPAAVGDDTSRRIQLNSQSRKIQPFRITPAAQGREYGRPAAPGFTAVLSEDHCFLITVFLNRFQTDAGNHFNTTAFQLFPYAL